MKGTTILGPLEYILEANGENWKQGDKITGSLRIKNHSKATVTQASLSIALVEGQYKGIKDKGKSAWKNIEKIKLEENFSLNAHEEKSYLYNFALLQDSLFTDKSGSLYLAFFKENEAWPIGHVELVVGPKLVITQILEIFENFLRFKVAQIKFSKGSVEVKLTPPSSREFSSIDSLILGLKEVDKNLTLNYLFNVRVLDMSSGAMQTQKKTKAFEQIFNSKQYLMYGEALNQDFILGSLNAVVNEVKPKFL